jgi:hypothetical protein
MPVTIRGSGQVPVQVIQTVKTDLFSTTSGPFVDVPGWSATITPTSSSNRILVMASAYANSPGTSAYGVLVRNSSLIFLGDAAGANQPRASFGQAWGGGDGGGSTAGALWSLNFLDSPATTSATTYKIQVSSAGTTLWINGSYGVADASFSQRMPASMILMEISG